MSDGVQRVDVDAIRARAERATPGPWESYDGHHSNTDRYDAVFVSTARTSPADNTRGDLALMGRIDQQAHSDAAFIAHARTDIPALLDALAAAEARAAALEALRAAVAEWTKARERLRDARSSDERNLCREQVAIRAFAIAEAYEALGDAAPAAREAER